jgi:hypothetical protein
MLPKPAFIKLSKLDAAKRQLDAAVRAFFTGEDPVAVHTLVGAAANIISDLVGHSAPEKSWDSRCAKHNSLSKKQYIDIVHDVQTFFKHADRDPQGKLDFDQCKTEHLVFIASLNLEELNEPGDTHLIELSLFQLWYIARWREIRDKDDPRIAELIGTADNSFPGLNKLSRDDQIRRGHNQLQALKAELLVAD